MSDIPSLPGPRIPLTARGDGISQPWFQFLRDLASRQGVDASAEIEALARKLGSPDGSIAGIPEPQASATVIGVGGVQSTGTLAQGRVTLTLRELEDSGEGELLAIERDAFGRVAGTRGVLPSDLPNPSWRFLIDPAGNYLTDPDGDLLRAPGYELDETLFLTSANPQISGGDEHAPVNASSITTFARNGNIIAEMVSASGTGAFAPRFNYYRSRGTLAAPADVLLGDFVGAIQFAAYASGAWNNSSRVVGTCDASPGTVAPGRLELAVASATQAAGVFAAGEVRLDSSPSFFPRSTNATALGKAANNWNGVYSNAFYSGASQVVGARRTGWAAATGTATRTTFDTTTVTTAQLAERVKALLDDLIAHGLIGA